VYVSVVRWVEGDWKRGREEGERERGKKGERRGGGEKT
jgi:hypothetical protein